LLGPRTIAAKKENLFVVQRYSGGFTAGFECDFGCLQPSCYYADALTAFRAFQNGIAKQELRPNILSPETA
jgi:hypothetical protein